MASELIIIICSASVKSNPSLFRITIMFCLCSHYIYKVKLSKEIFTCLQMQQIHTIDRFRIIEVEGVGFLVISDMTV